MRALLWVLALWALGSAARLWILWAGVQLAIADREDVLRTNLDRMIQSELTTLQALSGE